MRRIVLVAIVAACVLAAWSIAPGAQVIDGNACEQACLEQHRACVSACGTQEDPIECESDCRDQLEDCQDSC